MQAQVAELRAQGLPEEALEAWRAKTPGRLVFPTRGMGPSRGKGGYLRKSNLRKSFLRLLKRAKLPEVRFHDLRHTHATLALLKTKNVKAVSARLGHADIRVTLDTYTHFLPVREDQLVAAMEDLLAPKPLPKGPKSAESEASAA